MSFQYEIPGWGFIRKRTFNKKTGWVLIKMVTIEIEKTNKIKEKKTKSSNQ